MDKLSLLPDVYQARASARRAKRVWGLAVVGSVLLSGGAIGWAAMQSGPAESGRFAEQVALSERRAEESKQEALALGARLAQNRQALSAIDAVSVQPDWEALLDRISFELGGRAVLTSCRFGPITEPAIRQAVGLEGESGESSWLVLGGVADAYPDVPALLLRLEAMGMFKQVVLVETRGEMFSGKQRIGFRIACRAQ